MIVSVLYHSMAHACSCFRYFALCRNGASLSSLSLTQNDNQVATHATNLIIVAGHSVIIDPSNIHNAHFDESVWYLLPFQHNQGLPQAIVGHVLKGIYEAAKDVSSLLILSGGETRANTGPVNEGSSYFSVADSLNLWDLALQSKVGLFDGAENASSLALLPGFQTVRARTVTEEFATDSFENLYVAELPTSDICVHAVPLDICNIFPYVYSHLYLISIPLVDNLFMFLPAMSHNNQDVFNMSIPRSNRKISERNYNGIIYLQASTISTYTCSCIALAI